MLGNFMADSVKGKKYLDYPEEISTGIILHRFIDNYTDTHELVSVSKNLLRPSFGRYASPVSDIVYDHFLALHFEEFTGLKLQSYVQEVYKYMEENQSVMTDFSKEVLPYMIKQNWLENYQHKEPLQKIFSQFGKRIGVGDLFDTVTDVVWDNYDQFEMNFKLFFPELKNAVHEKHSSLLIK